MEEKELQQPVNNGQVFFWEFFEEGPISNIILQCPRLGTRTMMKWNGNVHVEKRVDKLVKKEPMSKAK